MRAKACSLSLAAVAFAVLPDLAGATDDLPAELSGSPMPQVLTPARLKQAQVDVGASVTVIDRDMIAALGARDVPELLRLVPGMMVTQESESGHTFAVNYHGTNLTDIRRLQVLVDGMSYYQPALARVLWSELPVAIDDIERIEVTRGPDAAAYGANSFSGVVNIITTHPQDSADHLVRVTSGDRDVLDGVLRMVGHGTDFDTRLTVSSRSDSGFDHVRGGREARDDRRGNFLNWRSEYRVSEADRVEFFLGAVDSLREAEADLHDGLFSRYLLPPVTEAQGMDAMGRWSRDLSPDHEIRVQAYSQRMEIHNPFRACLHPILLSGELATLSAINPDYAFGLLEVAADDPSQVPAFIGALPTAAAQSAAMDAVTAYMAFAGAGFNDICGNVDLALRESRVDVEVQDTLRVGERLRLVSGASYRRDAGASASYTGGQVDNELLRLFSHGEFRMIDPLLLNLGAMIEDDDISGTSISPKGALNLRVGEQQSVRLVGSRAWRTQDLYEEHAATLIRFNGLTPLYPDGSGVPTFASRDFFLVQSAPGNLVPEEMRSLELGYFGYFPETRVELDVRWFREDLDKLISDAINPFDFNSNNNSFTMLDGIEWQVRRTLAPGSWVWASYAYIDNDSTHRTERKFTALHSGSLAIAHRFASRLNASAAWYFSREQNRTRINDDDFDRLDLRLGRDVPLGNATLQLSINLQGRFTDVPHIHGDNFYDERINGYLGAQLTF